MKKCPVCETELNRVLLETNLPGYNCPSCNGIWISSNEFLAWVAPQPKTFEEITIEGYIPLPIADNRKALLCPDCGRLLRRFKIWPNIEFYLDRCGDCKGLARRPDPEAFAEHFSGSPETDVVAFPNLGGDAIMIVPRLKTVSSAYGHLAAFVREAPDPQCHALWQLVGETMTRRVGINPVWLSTAGAGVSWLHVRLDDRPKYYGFGPYCQTA